jgi:hypothetical protein
MKLKYKVLLVHNPFNVADPITYLSAGIRFATNSHWNHIAIEVNLLGKDYVIEAVGAGVICTDANVWVERTKRQVLILEPTNGSTIDGHELLSYIGKKYGALDIIQIAKYLYVRKYIDKNYTWNGIDGTRLWKGVICSELAAILMKIPNPHLIMPCDFESMSNLKTVGSINT